jgi:hypothetical protein
LPANVHSAAFRAPSIGFILFITGSKEAFDLPASAEFQNGQIIEASGETWSGLCPMNGHQCTTQSHFQRRRFFSAQEVIASTEYRTFT